MRVRLLGPVDVVADGLYLPVNGLRRKAVLAVHRDVVVSSDRLVDVVWGGKPPATPLNTVQRHMSYLRQLLGSRDVIVARSPGYLLDPVRVGTDVAEAERLIDQGIQAADRIRQQRLRDALALWRGRPLADVDALPWLRAESERLERLRLRASRVLAETRLALGEHALLLQELEALSREHPFDEQVHALLMLALYRSGLQADALGVYRHLRRARAGAGDGVWVAFRHEIARLAVAQAVPAHRAQAIHGLVLGALRSSCCEDDARMAFHAEAAGDGAAALRYASAAAFRAGRAPGGGRAIRAGAAVLRRRGPGDARRAARRAGRRGLPA